MRVTWAACNADVPASPSASPTPNPFPIHNSLRSAVLGTLPADVIVVTVSIALCLMVLVMMVRTMTRTILQALRVKGDERELMKMKAVQLLVLVIDTMTGHKLQGSGVDQLFVLLELYAKLGLRYAVTC